MLSHVISEYFNIGMTLMPFMSNPVLFSFQRLIEQRPTNSGIVWCLRHGCHHQVRGIKADAEVIGAIPSRSCLQYMYTYVLYIPYMARFVSVGPPNNNGLIDCQFKVISAYFGDIC